MSEGLILGGPTHEAPLGILVALYLLMMSAAEGLIFLGVWRFWQKGPGKSLTFGLLWAATIMALGPLNLLLDLSQPFRFINLYKTFVITSPPSWGAMVLPWFITFSLLFIWFHLRIEVLKIEQPRKALVWAALLPWITENKLSLELAVKMAKGVSLMALIAAVIMMIYTSMIVFIPFSRSVWASLPMMILFAASAIAVGASLYGWGACRYGFSEDGVFWRKVGQRALLLEGIVILLLLTPLFQYPGRGETVFQIFWQEEPLSVCFELLLGIVLPFFMLRQNQSSSLWSGSAALLILLGAAQTRYNLVAGLMNVTVSGRELMEFEILPWEMMVIVVIVGTVVISSELLVSIFYPLKPSIFFKRWLQRSM